MAGSSARSNERSDQALAESGYDEQAKIKVCGPWDKESIKQAIDDWNDDVMFNALNNEDGNLDDYEDDDWYKSDGISARDCIGWEEDMVKNGEYFK